jgi:hypothetical protein
MLARACSQLYFLLAASDFSFSALATRSRSSCWRFWNACSGVSALPSFFPAAAPVDGAPAVDGPDGGLSGVA